MGKFGDIISDVLLAIYMFVNNSTFVSAYG